MFLLVLLQTRTTEKAGAELESHPLEQLLKVLYHLYRFISHQILSQSSDVTWHRIQPLGREVNVKENSCIYYINTNEIPCELSRENMISSHVKISMLLWLHNKSHLSQEKTVSVKWFGISLVFI